ncbi:MAG TPA: YbaB/EbfC family nucleoid-associated protein [Gammaproteobacteria bacterium]|nr:YbaB/EbfC family nucleoid-associated protein [Gammaproteobacteria bacterium]
MKGGLSGLMKQAQQIQENMQKAQEELARAEVEGQAGGGMVKVVMSGKHEVRRVVLDDSLLSEDKEMVEDLIAAATNDAVHRVGKMMEERFAGMTSGMGLPPGMKLPF